MSTRLTAVTFDVDPASLASFRKAFPNWEIAVVNDATNRSLERDWSPQSADLLVIGAREQVGETLGLCRSLRGQEGRAHTPILVLLPPDQEPLVGVALDAGADFCLILPIHAEELLSRMRRSSRIERPGQHTSNLERALQLDPWQDDGGES